jgi:hypothetical protein
LSLSTITGPRAGDLPPSQTSANAASSPTPGAASSLSAPRFFARLTWLWTLDDVCYSVAAGMVLTPILAAMLLL